jgi:hypothetical protein
VSRTWRWIPVITVIALLGAAMVAAVHAPPSFELADTSPQPIGPPPSALPDQLATPAPPPTMEPLEAERTLPPWVGTLITALCAAGVIALVAALLWLALRDRLLVRKAVPEVANAVEVRRRVREQLQAAVDEGLSDLDVGDTDPRRAVIACWARLEAAAAAAGTRRDPGDTSTDLVERMLTEHEITVSVLAGFAAVYREARFATHVIDVQMREQARAALIQVRDELVHSTVHSAGGAR